MYKFHEVQLAHANVQLEAVMDDYMFPAYVSPKLRSKSVKLGDVGDSFVRELEFSKITLRLVDKNDPKDDSDEHCVAKLAGDTFTTLQRILVRGFPLFLESCSYSNFI